MSLYRQQCRVQKISSPYRGIRSGDFSKDHDHDHDAEDLIYCLFSTAPYYKGGSLYHRNPPIPTEVLFEAILVSVLCKTVVVSALGCYNKSGLCESLYVTDEDAL